MKNRIFYAIVLLLMFSCRELDEIEEKIYYEFQTSDYERIISYEVGEVLNFKNENNEVLSLEVVCVSEEFRKTNYSSYWGLWSSAPTKNFDYDEKVIEFESSESHYKFNNNVKLIFLRFPDDYRMAKQNAFEEYPSSFNVILDSFPFWNNKNEHYLAGGSIVIDFSNEILDMNIGGINYENVYKIISNNLEIENGVQDVNIIYYDQYYGIIGFDDLNNMHWRISQ